MSELRFNPPPNWPPAPAGWTPPPGWEPDPAWGPAPHGWPLWVSLDASRKSWFGSHKVATVVGSVVGLVIMLGVIGAVAGPSNKKTPSTSIVTQPAAQSHIAVPSSTAPTPKSTPTVVKPVHHVAAPVAKPPAASWTMPDLRGTDLQTAQDAIQSLTDDAIWYTSSHDASGQGRGQWLDRDWQVCDQSVAPGTRITAGAKIDFGVVRRDVESCP